MVAGLALVVTVSLAVAWGVHQYASTTPRFSVVIIDVVGNRRLSDSEVLRRAGVAEGMNLFVLDTEATEQALLAVPWIEEVKVTRELPRTLRIELVEREAAAVAVVGSRSWLVTPEGVPFKELAAGDPYDLPLLTGVTLEDLLQDREGAVGRLKTGIDVLRQYGRTAPGRVHVAQEVNLGEDGGVVLTVGKQGMTFHLGRGQVRRKLLMAERIIAQLGRRGRMPGILFLDNEAHPERVVARMR
ncbi:MAG: FtsQ-type POTRA domain-containing protein [Polyangiaceae bacterium]|nr:FtsQ-type POTRA domain-containing protein [Polyangiaceae bacterium]